MGFGIYSCILCLVNALALNCILMHLFLSMLGHSYTHKLQIKRVPSPAQSLDSNAQLQPTVQWCRFQNFFGVEEFCFLKKRSRVVHCTQWAAAAHLNLGIAPG